MEENNKEPYDNSKILKYRVEAIEKKLVKIDDIFDKISEKISKNSVEIALMKLKMVMFSTLGGFLGSGIVALLFFILERVYAK